MRVSLSCRALGLGVGFFAAACTTGGGGNESSSGVDSDACTPGALNCMCEAGGCEAGLVCASGFCVAGSDTSATDVVSTSATTTDTSVTGSGPGSTGSSGDSMTTGTPPDCDDGPGMSQQCPAQLPYCTAAGTCVDCSGLASCADIDAATPACDAGTGLCVECTATDAQACSGATPVCDPGQNACVKCDAHEQCSSGACDLENGTCFPDGAALWVDRQATCGGAGTQDDPFCEIQDAVVKIAPGTPTVVHVLPGPGPYKTKIDVGSNVVAAIVGEGGSPVIDVDIDALLVNEQARVFLHKLRFVGSSIMAGKGLVCLSADVWADGVEFTSRKAVALDAVGCQLELRRSRVYLNPGGGLKLNSGSTRLENSFVTSNGTNFSLYGGVLLSNLGELTAVYSTIVGNNSDQNADSIHCNDPGPVALRNVVLFGQSQATSVSCDGAVASDSIVDSMLLAGGRNVMVEPLAQSTWFKDAPGGDFHVKDAAPFADLGRWRAGDPRVDYDGEARPDVDLSSDWAGADRLP